MLFDLCKPWTIVWNAYDLTITEGKTMCIKGIICKIYNHTSIRSKFLIILFWYWWHSWKSYILWMWLNSLTFKCRKFILILIVLYWKIESKNTYTNYVISFVVIVAQGLERCRNQSAKQIKADHSKFTEWFAL